MLKQAWYVVLGSVMIYAVIFAASWGHHAVTWAKSGDRPVQVMAVCVALVAVVIVNRIGKATHERLVGS